MMSSPSPSPKCTTTTTRSWSSLTSVVLGLAVAAVAAVAAHSSDETTTTSSPPSTRHSRFHPSAQAHLEAHVPVFLPFSSSSSSSSNPALPKDDGTVFTGSPASQPDDEVPSWPQVAAPIPANFPDVNNWLKKAAAPQGSAYEGLFANIHPAGTSAGCVIASPSKNAPNYYYHWARDGALTMDVVVTMYIEGRKDLEPLIWQYAAFTKALISLPSAEGVGEPKFNVDGSAFTGGWCRPQTDGPGLIASTLIRFANHYLATGGSIDVVKKSLYSPDFPPTSVIKKAIDYVANNWANLNNCDLWEEIRGAHFYTQMVQRRALVESAAFAKYMNDTGAADYYYKEALALSTSLDSHWDAQKGYVISTRIENRAGLDASLILAVIHSDTPDGVPLSFGILDERMQSTIVHLVNSFEDIYKINMEKVTADGLPIGLAIGRYAEDVYDGNGVSLGNPWFLCTAAIAEFLYKTVDHLMTARRVVVTPVSLHFYQNFIGSTAVTLGTFDATSAEFDTLIHAIITKGDAYMRRVMAHTPDGRLPEEYNRNTGVPQGARDLTWSYASIITANNARARMDAKMGSRPSAPPPLV